ncbi:MAG: hypothetical protein NC117_10040 [Pseudoflavonifractor sp.]|nr:hypothetical protein [Pseudoflavonifractor sp.]
MSTLYPRYSGRFNGLMPFFRNGDRYTSAERLWEVAIYQMADAPFAVADLMFAADAPLTIEWGDTDPTEAVEGSTATLRLISPGDRTFADLYTVDPLGVVVEVKASGAVVWRGSMEPELYEEPYSTPEGYVVELSFSDLGPMDRRDFALEGRVTLHQVLTAAIDATALSGYSLKSATMVNDWSTGAQTPLNLSRLCISADNFYDEDREPQTLREAVETILRPFGLRMRQQGGSLWIYDWHSLASETPSALRTVDWTSTDQTLSVAPVAHAVTLTYSPYADTTLAEGDISADDVSVSDSMRRIEVMVSDDTDEPSTIHGFYIYRTDGVSATINLPAGLTVYTDLYRIVAGHSANDAAGAFGMARTKCSSGAAVLAGGVGVHEWYPERTAIRTPDYTQPVVGSQVLRLLGPWLQAPASAMDYRIRVTLDFLLDTRGNPFETAGRWNEKGHYSDLQNWANFGYVPCSLELIDDNGTPLMHYVNAPVMKSSSRDQGLAGWQSGAASPGDMWLAYYDTGNRKSASGWGGWKTNRQCIGYFRDELPAIYDKQGEGEFIPWPTGASTAGRLRLTVYSGIHWFDYNRRGQSSGEKDLLSRINWVLYGAPAIEVVRVDGSAIPTDDVVYTATAIKGAASDVDLSIQAGSAAKAPTARAVISTCSASGGNLRPVDCSTFARSRTASLEELLLDTLVSQYDTPRVLLSGEANLSPVLASEPHSWQDAGQPSARHFVPTSVAVDAAAGVADYTFREISPDIYTPNQ